MLNENVGLDEEVSRPVPTARPHVKLDERSLTRGRLLSAVVRWKKSKSSAGLDPLSHDRVVSQRSKLTSWICSV